MLRNDSKAKKSVKVAPSGPKPLGPDPESFTEVAQGNFLLRLAVALEIIIGVFALVLALSP